MKCILSQNDALNFKLHFRSSALWSHVHVVGGTLSQPGGGGSASQGGLALQNQMTLNLKDEGSTVENGILSASSATTSLGSLPNQMLHTPTLEDQIPWGTIDNILATMDLGPNQTTALNLEGVGTDNISTSSATTTMFFNQMQTSTPNNQINLGTSTSAMSPSGTRDLAPNLNQTTTLSLDDVDWASDNISASSSTSANQIQSSTLDDQTTGVSTMSATTKHPMGVGPMKLQGPNDQVFADDQLTTNPGAG